MSHELGWCGCRSDLKVPNGPTGQVLEAGPGWPVLVRAMTGPDSLGWSGPV